MGNKSCDGEDIIRMIGAEFLSWLKADTTGLTEREVLHFEVRIHRINEDVDWFEQESKYQYVVFQYIRDNFGNYYHDLT